MGALAKLSKMVTNFTNESHIAKELQKELENVSKELMSSAFDFNRLKLKIEFLAHFLYPFAIRLNNLKAESI